MKSIYKDLTRTLKGKLELNANMAIHTGLGAGGNADLLIIPHEINDLSTTLKVVKNIPITILGGGQNVLVRDGGIRGLTVLTTGLSGLEIQGNLVTAMAGQNVMQMAQKLAEAGIAGFEFLSGIPGSLGGAIRGNAGAHEANLTGIGGLVESVDIMDYEGSIRTLIAAEMGFRYRKSNLPENHIIVSAKMRGKPGNPDEIRAKMAEMRQFRLEKQPQGVKTCGSLFKNPEGHSAGKLIDDAGWRGREINGAKMSEKHANFLINTGTASAKDLENLAMEVQADVLKKFGIMLELELKIIGEHL